MTRSMCVTRKVLTEFGNMYISIDLDAHGRPEDGRMGGRIATPEKEPESQITRLVETLSLGMDDALREATGGAA
jgi:hypothetical protein